jgi:hypothetical protein
MVIIGAKNRKHHVNDDAWLPYLEDVVKEVDVQPRLLRDAAHDVGTHAAEPSGYVEPAGRAEPARL